MTKSIRFTKMHGAGNDYIYVNTMVYPIDNPEELSIAWSKPHTGIGSDGLVLIGSSDIADFSMHIYNADGSEAMMCGNASRCIGKYVYEAGLTQKNKVTLETLSGIKELQLKIEREEVTEVTVDMGMPAVGEMALEVEAGGEIYTGTVISMGNPHLVIFVDEMDQVGLASVGPLLECLPLFPDRTNVEFVQVLKPDEVRMRVWERGSGITQACLGVAPGYLAGWQGSPAGTELDALIQDEPIAAYQNLKDQLTQADKEDIARLIQLRAELNRSKT